MDLAIKYKFKVLQTRVEKFKLILRDELLAYGFTRSSLLNKYSSLQTDFYLFIVSTLKHDSLL